MWKLIFHFRYQGMSCAPTNRNDAVEQEFGMRFCTTCAKMLPLSNFLPGKRHFKCSTHHRESKLRSLTGTPERRAVNSFRSRARQDMIMFGHAAVKVGAVHIRGMLTPERITNYSKYCIIPKTPDHPLSAENIMVATTAQRRYVISAWKAASNDAAAYRNSLAHILTSPF